MTNFMNRVTLKGILSSKPKLQRTSVKETPIVIAHLYTENALSEKSAKTKVFKDVHKLIFFKSLAAAAIKHLKMVSAHPL